MRWLKNIAGGKYEEPVSKKENLSGSGNLVKKNGHSAYLVMLQIH